MKAQCERCKEIVPLAFAVEAAGIRVTCPACRAEYAVAATATAAAAPAADPPAGQMTCPKCGEVQKTSDACRRCGLLIARWSPGNVLTDPALGDAREAAGLWKQVETSWDDGKRHDAFIDHCRRAGVLAFAAARYRQALPARPNAADRLTQIRTLAEQSLAAVPRNSAPAARNQLRTVLVATVVVVLLALIWTLIQSAFDAPRY